MAKSKNKGSGYERKVAKIFSDSFKVEFKKCPHSGAIGTRNNIPGLQGDIIRADLKPIPYIECKKYKDFRLEHFLLRSGNEWDWIKQTLGNIKDDRKWVVIFQKDYGRQHWAITNIQIDNVPKCVLTYLDATKIFYLTTLDIALKDINFRREFE